MNIVQAKTQLDVVINKSRVHLYKPIQIAEILYRDRVHKDIQLADLETYRIKSRKWRDQISIELLGRKCSSSARFQDNVFDVNAVPVEAIIELGRFNKEHKGIVEAYIYSKFSGKYEQLNIALDLCRNAEKTTFKLLDFINSFSTESGLKRSLDKIYEIIVYSLFSTVIENTGAQVSITIPSNQLPILSEFSELTKALMCLDPENMTSVKDAKIYRVGVTNAADRGVDMYANWGPLVQVKHLSLDVELAESIVNGVTSDKIVIVCKKAEKSIINSIVNQVGWKSRVQAIITELDLIEWYEKALRGTYSELLGQKLLDRLVEEVLLEFPSTGGLPEVLLERKYSTLKLDDFSYEELTKTID